MSLSNWSETVHVEFGDSATYWYKNPTKMYQIPNSFFNCNRYRSFLNVFFFYIAVVVYVWLDFVWLKIWAGKEGCWFDHVKCASCPLYIFWVMLNVMRMLPFQCLATFLLLVSILSKQFVPFKCVYSMQKVYGILKIYNLKIFLIFKLSICCFGMCKS